MGSRQAVRHRTLTPALEGSNPSCPVVFSSVNLEWCYAFFMSIFIKQLHIAVKDNNQHISFGGIILKHYTLTDLNEIMSKLLSENGCPWDKAQTHQSLKKYLIEESYEVIDAINKNDDSALAEELGDVLLQVVFHAAISENFNINDVLDSICKKMILRHPHIFANGQAETASDVEQNWEEIKKVEKGYKSKTDILKSVPSCLPSLMRAEKIVKKANDNHLNADELNKTFGLLQQDLLDLKVDHVDESKNTQKIGEILLRIVRISSFFKVNCEFALTNAVETYINNFESIENADLHDNNDLLNS